MAAVQSIKRYITNFLIRAFLREKQGPYPGPYLMGPRGPGQTARARGLARIWRRPSKPDVEGSNPSGSAVHPEKTKRLPNEAQLASMEEERKHAVEMEKEENAPQEKSRKEAEVMRSSFPENCCHSFQFSIGGPDDPSGSMV